MEVAELKFLCIDFINSQWYKTHELYKDPLKDENWVVEFINKWDLPLDDALDEKQIETLLELRSLLSSAIYDLCDEKPIDPRDLMDINKYMESFRFNQTIKQNGQKYELVVVPSGKTIDRIIYEVMTSFSELVTENELNRIKFCQNPECRWIFYDESKSRTRKWCDNTCASLMKVRKYREKHKNNEGDQNEKK